MHLIQRAKPAIEEIPDRTAEERLRISGKTDQRTTHSFGNQAGMQPLGLGSLARSVNPLEIEQQGAGMNVRHKGCSNSFGPG